MNRRLENFVVNSTVEAMKRQMQTFSTKQELNWTEERINDTLSKYSIIQKQFTQEHEQMKQIIQRFDEVISDKMNKNELLVFKMQIQTNYLNKEQLQLKFNDVMAYYHKLESDLRSS